ncbi:MAG TPA: hypothetical protein VJ183_01785 [Chloroflexia bacterium]|nr:hypothetical protein [Chloroflexia bacterium]
MALDNKTKHARFQIVSMLGSYRKRVRCTRRRRYLAISALGIGTTWLITALIYYFDLPVQGALPIAVVLTFLLPLLALAIEAARKPTLSDTAALLDRRLDNNQRLITSVELMSRGETVPLTDAQIKTSATMLARVQPKALYPTHTPWNLTATGLGLLLLALSLFMLKGGGFSPFGVGTLPPDQPVVASLAAPTADPGLPPSELTPEPTPTAEPDELALDGGAQDDQSGEATATPDQPTSPQDQADASQQAESDLARLGRALDGQSVTQQAADALKQGNTDEAAQELTELGKENDQVSKAAKEGLADALEQAAQDTDANRLLKNAERDAAKALRDGDYKSVEEAMQNLADAMQQTAANVIPQQELAKNFPEESSGGEQGASQQPGDQSEQGNTGAGEEEGDQSGQEGPQGGGETGQAGKSESDQPGQGGGDKSQGGEGSSQSGAPGQGTRVNGPKDTTDLDVPGNPFELDAKPEPGNTQPQPNQQQDHPGLTLDGGAGASGASPVSPGNAVNVPGETGSLPLDRWEVIRKFFTPEP